MASTNPSLDVEPQYWRFFTTTGPFLSGRFVAVLSSEISDRRLAIVACAPLSVCSNVIESSRVENLFHLTGKTIPSTFRADRFQDPAPRDGVLGSQAVFKGGSNAPTPETPGTARVRDSRRPRGPDRAGSSREQ